MPLGHPLSGAAHASHVARHRGKRPHRARKGAQDCSDREPVGGSSSPWQGPLTEFGGEQSWWSLVLQDSTGKAELRHLECSFTKSHGLEGHGDCAHWPPRATSTPPPQPGGQPELQVPNRPANPDALVVGSLRIPVPGGDPSCVGPQHPGPHALSALGAPLLPCPVTRPAQACSGRWPPTRSLDVLELCGERRPPLPDNVDRQSLLCSPSSSLCQAACGKRAGRSSLVTKPYTPSTEPAGSRVTAWQDALGILWLILLIAANSCRAPTSVPAGWTIVPRL